MDKNTKKRIVIIFIWIIFFVLIFWLFYVVFRTKQTCFDGIKNQNEEDVDCGGVCSKKCKKMDAQALIVGETGVLDGSTSGEYDFFGVVSNPNNLYGSEYFDYKIKFFDENGLVLGEKTGNSFILPGEKKYIIENNIALNKIPTRSELTISNSKWIEFNEQYEQPDLKIINKTFGEITSGVGFYEAKGLVKNDSPYDFAIIKIKVILKDAEEKIIALNSTEMRTVRSGEIRDFRVFWPERFSGNVANPEMQIEVNIFNSDTFAKKNIKTQQFQSY